jgi:hypothetical protein
MVNYLRKYSLKKIINSKFVTVFEYLVESLFQLRVTFKNNQIRINISIKVLCT